MALPNASGSALARIRASLQGASKSKQKVGRFILRSPARAVTMSIDALGRACGTSPTTLTRFCTGLGYAGYREFQVDLATAVARAEPVTLDEFAPDASPKAIIRQVFQGNCQGLLETEKVLDHDTVIRVARIIRRAGRIVVLGVGGSAQMARDAAQRFMSLGLPAVAAEDPMTQVFATTNTGPGDVVIGISHTGQTASVIEAVRTAREQGARTVALTNYPRSPLAKASEFRLLTAFREHRINASVSSSRIAQMCVIDSLYFILGSWGSRKATKLARAAEERAQKVLRWRATGRKTSRKKKG